MITAKHGGKLAATNIKPDTKATTNLPKNEKKRSGHTKPEAPPFRLDVKARLRVKHMLALLGISHSTFCAGIKSGRYPRPDGYDGKLPFWNTSTANDFLEGV
jgi:predicted DNA-binding transcriptional regulator AlpA